MRTRLKFILVCGMWILVVAETATENVCKLMEFSGGEATPSVAFYGLCGCLDDAFTPHDSERPLPSEVPTFTFNSAASGGSNVVVGQAQYSFQVTARNQYD